MTETPAPSNILIVDDEATAVENLAHVCRKEGYSVTSCYSGQDALQHMNTTSFDVILTDLRMEKIDGMAILAHAQHSSPDCAVIVITGFATLDSAVTAMKAGAYHYIAKPYRLDEVREVVRKALQMVQLKRENTALKQQLESNNPHRVSIITQDAIMQRLLDNSRHIAPTDTNVLISGESGTGKELLAQFIHQYSARADQTFQAINCGALQEDLLANELFGHEKGAFTGATDARAGLIETAEGGSLFLDEIAEMSLAMQVKLLRVIQEREVQRLGATHAIKVDIRLIAATHRNLMEEVAAGRFREDLYYRLNVVTLHLPNLADRRGDIPMLAYYFLRKHTLRMQKNIDDITSEAVDILMLYDYPGNIRELENIIERSVAFCHGNQIGVADLPPTLIDHKVLVVRPNQQQLPTLAQREVDYIEYVLSRSGNNRTRAAKVLGIDRVSLWRKLKKYGLVEEE